jgi:hypothetical protein
MHNIRANRMTISKFQLRNLCLKNQDLQLWLQIFILVVMANPVIGFGIAYGNEMIYCEARMDERSYDIYFNGTWTASVEQSGQLNWIQASEPYYHKLLSTRLGKKSRNTIIKSV